MIIDFRSQATEDIYNGVSSKEARKIPQNLWPIAQRKMDILNAAVILNDLRIPPGNHLEFLKGNLKGKLSIRMNDQYRLVFSFEDGNAHEVEILDYH